MGEEKIAVLGAGTMGSGIAQAAIEAGFKAVVIDTDQGFVERGINNIRNFLERKLAKGKIDETQFNDLLSRLTGTTDLATGVIGAVMVIEAVYENLELKKELFSKLDALCHKDVILASNTSTISISEIASAVKEPGRVIGTHYFSPVPVMKLVEIVKGEKTSEDTAGKTIDLCRAMGKTPIAVKDVPGFIVNRFLCLMYNEAANMVYNGVAKAEDIDAALKLGCNWPMGVCQIMDMAGVDVTYHAMQSMYAMTREERYKPSPQLKQMVEHNNLGQKTGKGFYEY